MWPCAAAVWLAWVRMRRASSAGNVRPGNSLDRCSDWGVVGSDRVHGRVNVPVGAESTLGLAGLGAECRTRLSSRGAAAAGAGASRCGGLCTDCVDDDEALSCTAACEYVRRPNARQRATSRASGKRTLTCELGQTAATARHCRIKVGKLFREAQVRDGHDQTALCKRRKAQPNTLHICTPAPTN